MKNTITRTKNTVSATYLPYAAYKSAITLATAHKGEIGKTDKGNFKATFNSVETAKKFVTEWTAEYNANRKVEVAPAPKSVPAPKTKSSKPTSAKGKTVTVTLDGVEYTVPASALVPTQAPAKAKGTTSSTKKTDTRSAEDFVADLVKSDKKLAKIAHIDADDKARKPRNAKGVTFDFGKIKGKTNSDKNKALHAMLVSKGIADSRTPEYQAVWTARPWAK